MLDVRPGTVVVYSDIGCPWAHLTVYRLLSARSALGLDGEVALDHRAFCLEVVNNRTTPKRILDAEVAVLGGLEPDAGWQMWQDEDTRYPITTLLALEAVQAAKEQGLEASERLDRGLRLAFFGQSRCVSMRHVILDVAGECSIDVDALRDALDNGRARRAVFDQHQLSQITEVQGSPHLFVADGTGVHNPGIESHWAGEKGVGFPVIDSDDPSVYRHLLQRAADTAA